MQRKTRAQIEQEHAEQDRKAEEGIALYGYPALKGTEKQVKWAKAIREQALERVRQSIINTDCGCNMGRLLQAILKRIAEIHTLSGYWIGKRRSISHSDGRMIEILIDEAVESYGGSDKLLELCK